MLAHPNDSKIIRVVMNENKAAGDAGKEISHATVQP